MATVTIKIKTDNDAFVDGHEAHEVARILRCLAEDMDRGYIESDKLRDINGHAVGSVTRTGK